MRSADRAVARAVAERLLSLAGDLRRRGFVVQLVATDARRDLPPGRLCLWISSQADMASFKVVYAALAGDGTWWLCWPEATRLARLGDLSAADRIAQALAQPAACDGSGGRECRS
jgi:hypothetical protein